jgi:diaminopimelate epimerase
MESSGNHFIIVDEIHGYALRREKYGELSNRLCSHEAGRKVDACIFQSRTVNADAMIHIHIFDRYGNRLPVCGNGTRCFAKYLYEKHLRKKRIFRIDTGLKVVETVILGAQGNKAKVSMDMGSPKFVPKDIPALFTGESVVQEPLDLGDITVRITALSMGNPHAVILVDNVDKAPVAVLGSMIENHWCFPEKTNVEFVQVVHPGKLRVRIWEREEGETPSCATGACAALVAACLQGLCNREAVIAFEGGEFEVVWDSIKNDIQLAGIVLHGGDDSIEIDYFL